MVTTTFLFYHRTKSEINMFHEVLGLLTVIFHLWANWEKYISESTKVFLLVIYQSRGKTKGEKSFML